MKLKRFTKAVGARVAGGTEYMWKCYPDARYMDIADIDGTEVAHCIFSTKTHEIYAVEVHVESDDVAYRWIDPDWLPHYVFECKERGVEFDVAYDNVSYTNIYVEYIILELAKKVVHKTYVHSHYHTATIGDTLKRAQKSKESKWEQAQCSAEEWRKSFASDAEWQAAADAGGVGCDADEDGFDAVGVKADKCCGHCGQDANEEYESEGEAMTRIDAENERARKVADLQSGTGTEYTVKITVTHVLDVKATSMERAVMRAKGFVNGLKPTTSVESVSWMDSYNTKEEVSRQLVNKTYED